MVYWFSVHPNKSVFRPVAHHTSRTDLRRYHLFKKIISAIKMNRKGGLLFFNTKFTGTVLKLELPVNAKNNRKLNVRFAHVF